MLHFLNFVWFVVFVFIIGEKGSAYSLEVSNKSEEYGYYNIYNKIDSMQKAFQTLETNVQRKNKMLRQILQPITKMDDNIEMSDQSSQVTKTVQPLQRNGKFKME